ncbi:hypothetical protein F2Q70_00029323 [Brassica cretica]|uniref:Uncharacterized protein n=1 Tax=Brassica cretica TaxID=69181 RepID=A0A8S9FIA5_BRACR|nr:hypothetical protein F2Q70_00029323 [Brassica cretica]
MVEQIIRLKAHPRSILRPPRTLELHDRSLSPAIRPPTSPPSLPQCVLIRITPWITSSCNMFLRRFSVDVFFGFPYRLLILDSLYFDTSQSIALGLESLLFFTSHCSSILDVSP